MTDYLCFSLLSHPSETVAAFTSRLTAFWSQMLREHEADFEKVYAEMTTFQNQGSQLVRKYLIEADVADTLMAFCTSCQMAFAPVDVDDVYTKYEAAPPDWFQIEH